MKDLWARINLAVITSSGLTVRAEDAVKLRDARVTLVEMLEAIPPEVVMKLAEDSPETLLRWKQALGIVG